ncbi:MAG: prephenate dehydrogenase/arogenate dehydrogenase family protein [Oscillospiraceae bacterium]|nr:prephenate dehydrogenase/arogenate dehydrogenase family protein [Oscillospiraceae bacterium]
MKILIIGLGLIGGSFCKAITSKTNHTVYGYDLDKSVLDKALKAGCIEMALDPSQFGTADMSVICLPPQAAMRFAEENMKYFAQDSVMFDVCGVKADIVSAFTVPAHEHKVRYVGAHPMAGREFGGFDYSLGTLFENRSFIVTPTEDSDEDAVSTVISLAKEIGFTRIVSTSPKQHDATIAYTSQLAHVVSSAYVKSPTIENESGFTAGSFQDMTRIATVNENMWTDLFMENQKYLLRELDTLIGSLSEYRNAIRHSDKKTLCELLKEGRLIKEKDLERSSDR